MIPIHGLVFLWQIKEISSQSILLLLFIGCYGVFICGCGAFTGNLLRGERMGYEILYAVASLFVEGATYFAVWRVMMEKVVPVVNKVSNGEAKSFCLMPFLYISLQAVFFILYDIMKEMENFGYFIVLFGFTIFAYFLIRDSLRILRNGIEKEKIEEENTIMGKLFELQKQQYASLTSQMKAIQRERHDLKHHIAIIQNFLDKDDKAGLQEYVQNFQHIVTESLPIMLCKNVEVNIILLHYYEKAQRENIKFEIYADIENDITINVQDLVVICGNCLENAFEACARMESFLEKKVSFMAKPMGKGLAIIIDNTFDGKIHKKGDVYLSSKRNHQTGIGMDSVQRVVKKYAGIILFETKENLFMTSIRLSGKTREEVKYGRN
ncbi:MAG: ATP-binding protein [Acetivibrio sp.]